jgi:hypothetical protein
MATLSSLLTFTAPIGPQGPAGATGATGPAPVELTIQEKLSNAGISIDELKVALGL